MSLKPAPLKQLIAKGSWPHAYGDHRDEALCAHSDHGDVCGFFVGDEEQVAARIKGTRARARAGWDRGKSCPVDISMGMTVLAAASETYTSEASPVMVPSVGAEPRTNDSEISVLQVSTISNPCEVGTFT